MSCHKSGVVPTVHDVGKPFVSVGTAVSAAAYRHHDCWHSGIGILFASETPTVAVT